MSSEEAAAVDKISSLVSKDHNEDIIVRMSVAAAPILAFSPRHGEEENVAKPLPLKNKGLEESVDHDLVGVHVLDTVGKYPSSNAPFVSISPPSSVPTTVF